MIDRRFTEVDLRRMMEHASGFSHDVVENRWVINVRHKRKPWNVIVEPDYDQHVLVVITAYPTYTARGE
jgi:hypothetical protein